MISQDHDTAEKMMSIFNVDFYDVWKSCWLACCIYRILGCGCSTIHTGSYRRCRSEEHTSELQSPYVISYAVFCLKKKMCIKHFLVGLDQYRPNTSYFTSTPH